MAAVEDVEERINAWLRDHLIPRLAVVFGEKCNSSIEYRVSYPSGSFFLSQIFFVCVQFPGGERSLVVKVPSEDPLVLINQSYDDFFANEKLFYERLSVKDQDNYARMYLGGADPVFEDVIVLEDLRQQGFTNSPKKLNTELDYLVAALRCFGRLHGQTYLLKERAAKELQEIKAQIRISKYCKYDNNRSVDMNFRMCRIVDTLRQRNYDPIFVDKIDRIFQDCFRKVMLKCIEPVEPLATIVHGDATINNILFQRQNGSLKAILVDFALIFYTSPAIDVSTLLFLSCNPKELLGNFDQLFKAYHDSLAVCLKEYNCWNPVKYSYDAFVQDYKEHSIFGFIITVFFLPIMLEYVKNDAIPEPQRILDVTKEGGDDHLLNFFADMLIDMRVAGLLDHLVQK